MEKIEKAIELFEEARQELEKKGFFLSYDFKITLPIANEYGHREQIKARKESFIWSVLLFRERSCRPQNQPKPKERMIGEVMRESKTVSQQEKPFKGELLTIDEAVKYIRLGKTSLYDCIKRGEIPFFRPPRGKILLDTADLDDWLRLSKIPASTVPGKI